MDPKTIVCKLQGPDSQGNGGGTSLANLMRRSITTKTCRYPTLRRQIGYCQLGDGLINSDQEKIVISRRSLPISLTRQNAHKQCPDHHFVS
jgi:hypothetical protein